MSPGKEGSYALHLPGGTSAYVDANNKSDLGLANGTMAFWARIRDSGVHRGLAGVTDPDGNGSSFKTGFQITRASSNTMYCYLGNGSTQYAYLGNSQPASVGDWHHYAMTWDSPINTSSDFKFYIDGVDTGATVTTNVADVIPGGGIALQELTLGTTWRNSPTLGTANGVVTGSMDEFAVWDTPLSAVDIASLYGGTLSNAISSSNLILYYDFEGGPGNSTIVDRSTAGNDHTGDFNNMSAGTITGSAAATLSAYLDMECNGPGSAVLKDLGANDLSGTLINASTGSCGEG